jgi:hypothetical protein
LIPAIVGFVTSKAGKYILGAGGLILGFVLLRAHFIHQGQLEGQQQATDSLTAVHQKELQKDREDYIAIKDRADKQFDAAQKLIDSANQRELLAQKTIDALTRKRVDAANNVAAVKDSDLHDFIVGPKGLSIRPNTDKSPGYSASEERAIATCVSDYPICKSTLSAQTEQIGSVADKVSGLAEQVNQLQVKYDGLAGYTVKVERGYTELYNAFPRKGNKIVQILTFGLAGKPKKIPTPDPKVLFSTKGGQ